MRSKLMSLAAACAAMGLVHVAEAEVQAAEYSAADLLLPCLEADSDAREVGAVAETECEQYIMGFVHALQQTGGTGKEAGVCPPEVNTADEVRWAFTRWVHGSYTERKAMSAADALLATLKESFACKS